MWNPAFAESKGNDGLHDTQEIGNNVLSDVLLARAFDLLGEPRSVESQEVQRLVSNEGPPYPPRVIVCTPDSPVRV